MSKMTQEHKDKMQAARKAPKTVAEHMETLRDSGICGKMLQQAKLNLENMGASMCSLYVKTITGDASARQRIKVFCVMCMGWEKYEVAGCTSLGCPLYGARPILQKRSKSSESAILDGENDPEEE